MDTRYNDTPDIIERIYDKNGKYCGKTEVFLNLNATDETRKRIYENCIRIQLEDLNKIRRYEMKSYEGGE